MSLLRIDEIFNFEKGVLQSSKCVPGEYDFITASSDWKTHNEYTHDCEALIFAAAASGSLGRTHYVNGKFISSDLCFIITPKDQKNLPVDLKFYHILFNELKDEIVRNTKAGTSKEAIGLGSFGRYQLPYLDIDIQIEIKNQFVNSEGLKSNLSIELNHQLDLVKKLRQQLLQDAVQGKLVSQNTKDEPASELLNKIKAEKAKLISEKKLKKEKELPPIRPDEIPFEIPENWVWCRLGEIGKITGGGTPSMANDEYWNGDIPWVSPKDMWTEFVSDTEMKVTPKGIKESSTNLIPVGSLLIVGRSGILKRKLPVAINSVECTVNQDMKVIIPHIIKMNRFLQFMFWGLESTILKEYVKFGMTVHSLKYDEFSQMPIPLPPIKEQERIVQKVEELMQYCNELEASIKQSESQNEKLLQQVLREALRKEPVEVE